MALLRGMVDGVGRQHGRRCREGAAAAVRERQINAARLGHESTVTWASGGNVGADTGLG